VDSLVVKSDTLWSNLRFQIAEKMVKPASTLNVGYKFSTDARAKAPNHLSKEMHLLELIADAREAIETAAEAKAKGKKGVKVFKVEIVDLDAGKDKEKAKKGKGKKKVR
jgi:hypothetical protein